MCVQPNLCFFRLFKRYEEFSLRFKCTLSLLNILFIFKKARYHLLKRQKLCKLSLYLDFLETDRDSTQIALLHSIEDNNKSII